MLQLSRAIAFIMSLAVGLAALANASMAGSPADLVRKAASEAAAPVDHSAWDQLLKAYVKAGPGGLNQVDYAAFKKSGSAELKSYIAGLEKVDPEKLHRSEQFAFFANLYNAKTIEIILDHYPVKSIKDISLGGGLFTVFTGGPWKAKVIRIKGVELSLDDIEHGILRPVFKDPRVHYAVNCASIGCPNLGTEAFTGATLEAQLDAGAHAYINNPRGVTVSKGKVVASSIYKWFKEDFGGDNTGILTHIRKYADPELAEALNQASSISSYTYDWKLNDTKAGQS